MSTPKERKLQLHAPVTDWASTLPKGMASILREAGIASEVVDDHTVRFDAVPLSEQFNKERTNLLIRHMRTQGRTSCFVDSDLSYQGANREVSAALRGPTHQNWRRIGIKDLGESAEDVLRAALRLLESPLAKLLDNSNGGADASPAEPSPDCPMLEATAVSVSAATISGAYRTSFRKEEAEQLAITTTQSFPRKSALLWGQPGVGLDHLMLASAHCLFEAGYVQNVYLVSSARLVATCFFQAEKDAALMTLFDEAIADPTSLLLVQQLDLCVSDSPACFALFSAALERGLRMVATVRHEHFLKEVREDPSLARRVLPVHVDEPNRADTVKAVEELARQSGIQIAPAAIQAAVRLAEQHNVAQPSAAIGILDAALAEAVWHNRPQISPDDVSAVLQADWPD